MLFAALFALAALLPGSRAAAGSLDPWIGERVLSDEAESVMIIENNGGGTLHVTAGFFRMCAVDAYIMPKDGRAEFSDDTGCFEGILVLGEDESITLTVTGGTEIYPGSLFYDYFQGKAFVFIREEKQNNFAEEKHYTTAAPEGEEFLITDSYKINESGSIDSWTHYEYDSSRCLTTKTECSSPKNYRIHRYDPDGHEILEEVHRYGSIAYAVEHTFDESGRETCKHTVTYADSYEGGEKNEYIYYDYDASGRHSRDRYIKDNEPEANMTDYEYSADGSSKRTQYSVGQETRGQVLEEDWFDASGKHIRQVYYSAKGILREVTMEYDQRGFLIRTSETDNSTVHETAVTEYENDEKGRTIRSVRTATSGVTVNECTYNSQGKMIREVATTTYGKNGDIYEYETVYDSSGRYRLAYCNTQTSFTKGAEDKTWSHWGYSYYLYEGDRGTLLGISPLPENVTAETRDLSFGTVQDTIRHMTRQDVTESFRARQVSDWVYDSEATVRLYGYNGRLRFVFDSSRADRLHQVWWYCTDEYISPDDIYCMLENDGVEWDRVSPGQDANAVNMDELTGSSHHDDGVTFIQELGGNTARLMICFRFYYYRPGTETVPTDPGAAYIPSQETAPEPEPESEPEPVRKSGPAGFSEAEAALWTGYWITGDEYQGELVITPGDQGTLRMKAFFLRTFEIEAELKPADGGSCVFETPYGHYTGVLTRADHDTLLFGITGGMSMEDDENEFYYFFKDKEYGFRAADYDEMWYEAPAEGPEDIGDWAGEWSAGKGGLTSSLQISRDDLGDYVFTLTFSTGYSVSGWLEEEDSRTMDLVSDDLTAMLTLNRKQNAILMTEIGTFDDHVYDWLDAMSYVIEYDRTGTVSETPAAEPEHESETVQPEPATPAVESLIPIPGRTDRMQVPVAMADATSYIKGSDPTAYMPFRMTDGEETTAYQFSTKETKLGDAYLYFIFGSPSEVDELWIKNGFWKITEGKDQYTRNCRVKKMTVEFLYSGGSVYEDPVTVNLKDDKKRKDWTSVSLGRRTGVTGIRIRIDDVYKGSKYKNDVCISEIMFVKKTDGE